MTDTASPTPSEPRSVLAVLSDSFTLLFRNYWPLAILGVVFVVLDLLLGLIFLIPLLGQLLGMFLYSLLFSSALLVALAIARRMASPFDLLSACLSPARLLELSVVLVPLGLVAVLERIVRTWFVFGGLLAAGSLETMAAFSVPLLIFGIIMAVLSSWILIKFAYSAFFIAAVGTEAAINPFRRMRQSMTLSRGRGFRLALTIIVIALAGSLFGVIPLIGPIVIEAALIFPLQLCALVVIYHDLIGRDLEGLSRREKTEADRAADDIAPV